jgi:hypothetical protein
VTNSVCVYIYINNSVCIYIYIYGGYILSISSDVVEAAQTPCREKIKKQIENLVRSGFYGSVSLIAQLEHSNQSVTMMVISHLQHI